MFRSYTAGLARLSEPCLRVPGACYFSQEMLQLGYVGDRR